MSDPRGSGPQGARYASVPSAALPLMAAIPAYVSASAIDRNPVRQQLIRPQVATLREERPGVYVAGLETGGFVSIVTTRASDADGDLQLALPHRTYSTAAAAGDLSAARWVGSRGRSTPDEVVSSYVDAFQFRQTDPATGAGGLREPQIGALHAVLAHWTTRSTSPATVVMPTGTGKTETMLALPRHQRRHPIFHVDVELPGNLPPLDRRGRLSPHPSNRLPVVRGPPACSRLNGASLPKRRRLPGLTIVRKVRTGQQ